MKKVICAVLAAVLACGLCGCSDAATAGIYTLVLNGKALDMPQPVTIEDLGSDYGLGLGVILTYKGNAAVGVKFKDGYDDTDERKRPIEALVRSYTCDTENTSFEIGGIELGDSGREVIDVYGEPTYRDEALDIWKYCRLGKSEDDYWLGVQFGDPTAPDKITNIYFRFQ